MNTFSTARLRNRLVLVAFIAIAPVLGVIVYSESHQQLWVLVFVTVAVIVGGFVAGEVFVFRPIQMLTAVTGRLAAGDFSARAQLPRGAPGMSELAGTINQMAMLLDAQWRERGRAEQSLREAEERMRFALEAASIGIWDADMTTGVVRWSAISEAQHGLLAGTFGGTFDAFLSCIHASDRQEVQENIDRATREHTDPDLLYRTTWPDGSLHWVRGNGRIVYDEAGVPVRAAGVGMDVTERQLLEAQLRQSQKMDAVGQLAGGIAHDFNNLLTAMSGFTELVLLTLDETDSRRADLLEVRKAAERAATLTRQLLAFSRRQMLLPQVLDVNALVAGTETLLRRTISEGIELVMALGVVEPVRVDASQLEQVLLNLALNAQDAMPKGGQLRFVTETVEVDEAWALRYPPMTPGRYVQLTVGDTGVGMTPETQARIFEPFFTTKPPGRGTGFGLATVYGIIKQSEGFIWVDSHVSRGTSLAIYLPAVDAPVEPMVRVVATGPVRGGSETILLAEDDGAVRRLAKHTLSYHGYTVLEGRDGDEALAIARQQSAVIHLLITDVVMPGLSGPDLATQLRMERPAMRVLYTSGYADNITARAGVEHGVQVLGKPFLPMDLLRKVREIFEVKSPSDV